VNAFVEEFWQELGHTFDKISAEGDIRAVVLASSLPKAFTAGLDLNAADGAFSPDSKDPSREALKHRDLVLRFQHSISAIERCRYPVIGATHSIAFGLGIDILSACDIRYAASDSKFSIKEVDVGMAADIGSLARMPKITGNESLLRELAFTVRSFGVSEAVQLGFVSKVVEGSKDEVVKEALKLAKFIASKSPIGVVGTKNVLLHSRDHSVQENLDYVAVWNQAMLQSDDMTQAIGAFKTKRAPVFNPLPKL